MVLMPLYKCTIIIIVVGPVFKLSKQRPFLSLSKKIFKPKLKVILRQNKNNKQKKKKKN